VRKSHFGQIFRSNSLNRITISKALATLMGQAFRPFDQKMGSK
jgi:hypothetical protein